MIDEAWRWLSGGAAGRSVLLFVVVYATATAATIAILVVVLALLPADYFRDRPAVRARPGIRPVRVVIRIARNALGIVLIALGAVLSLPLVPGQGVLTMLIGVLLLDFPGKRRVERNLVARPHALDTMNRVRAWLGRPPLLR
jgi:hypothetical protein